MSKNGGESPAISNATTTILNVDHTQEFQECMHLYDVGKGVHLFDTIALAIAFHECSCNVQLVITKTSANNY